MHSEIAAQPSALRGALGRAIESQDFTRGATAPAFGPRKHKEWQHFVAMAAGLDVLINFSLCDVVVGERVTHEQPRLVFLVRESHWMGDVENFPLRGSRIDHGAIHFELGANRLEFRDGVFWIEATLQEVPISVSLRLEPQTKPVFVPSTPMREGPPLHWLVVPRLRAHGTLTIAGRTHDLDGAPAYHDHNWGHFLWGHDLSWEWGFVLPEDTEVPWCLTFVRLTDRARTTAFDHKLVVWRGATLARSFREGELETNIGNSFFRPPSVFKVPPAMALLAPEHAADVPSYLENHARAGHDWLTCRCEPYDVVQVLIPSETDLGVTIFNEVSATAQVEGEIGGERVSFRGRTIMELIRHV